MAGHTFMCACLRVQISGHTPADDGEDDELGTLGSLGMGDDEEVPVDMESVEPPPSKRRRVEAPPLSYHWSDLFRVVLAQCGVILSRDFPTHETPTASID